MYCPPSLTKPLGAALIGTHRRNEDSVMEFTRHRNTMIEMRSGDGTSESHYAAVVTHYGFADNAAAKFYFDKLTDWLFKQTTDAQVDSVLSATNNLHNIARA